MSSTRKAKVFIAGNEENILVSMLTKDEIGRYYEYYLDEVIDGKYVVDTEKVEEEKALDIKKDIKNTIIKAIDTMRVEIDGVGFDGDEISQDRMNRAIQTLIGDETITWRLYDNTNITITQTELGKALRAAGIKMTELWFCTSIEQVEAIVSQDMVWLEKYKEK